MTPTPEELEKYRIKRLFKVKGRLLSINKKFGDSIWELILVKNTGENRKLFVFECRDKQIVSALVQLPLKTIIRAFFSIKTSEWKDKFYTTLVAERCDVVEKNEEKLKRLARQTELFSEHEYKGSLNKSFGGKGE